MHKLYEGADRLEEEMGKSSLSQATLLWKIQWELLWG